MPTLTAQVLVAAGDVSKAADNLPKTTNWVSMMLGAAFVLAVIAGVLAVAALIANKMGMRPLGIEMKPGALGVIFTGAMILGSVSGMVLWGSSLYTLDAMPAQQKVKPAYESSAPEKCKPVKFSPANDQDKAKKLMGDEFDKLKDKWALDTQGEPGDNKVAGVMLEYQPKDGACAEVSTCNQIHLTGVAAVNANANQDSSRDRWLDPAGYDGKACGSDKANQF